jgi:aminoglycoside phosphotransferase (APT) family kinase protein
VATGGRRDDDALREGLGRFVEAHPELVPGPASGLVPAPVVGSLRHADGGMANETLLVDLGPNHPGLAVRLAPLVPTFPSYDLAPQAAVQNAAAAAGVPAPSPAVVVDDPEWIGCPFLLMPRVHGDIAGPAPLFDPYVTGATPAQQRCLHEALIDTVADVHAVPWREHGLGAVLGHPTLHSAFERWASYVSWASEGDPLPALAEALEWCGRTLPVEGVEGVEDVEGGEGGEGGGGPVLLWGDVRLGNLVFDGARRVTAVLDWDLAALGPRELDLGWHFGLEFMMERLFGDRVPGFPEKAESLARYEARSGHAVTDLDWHEVFALVRALAINDRHQRIRDDPRRRDNPMGAVLLERLQAAG